MRIAEPALAIGGGSHRHAVSALCELEWAIDEVDREHGAMRVLEHATRDRSAVSPRAMDAEPSTDDEVCVDLGCERDDLHVRLAGADVEPRAPRGTTHGVERAERGLLEAPLRGFGVALVIDDVDEVNVGCRVSRGLIERVLEDDLGVLGEVERDDDTEVLIALHAH